MLEYFLERFREGSTTRGLIWVLGSFSVATLNPEQAQAVTALVMALAGANGVVVPDRLR